MDRSVYENMRRIERTHWWFCARRRILSEELRRMDIPSDARILEVGCGTGGNLGMLSHFGHVVGLEPDEESRAYAARETGVPVVGGFLPEPVPEFEAPFDVIAAFDVIEHLDRDLDSVAALMRLLKPGGRIISTVPAHAWMWSEHDVVHHHKRRYRREDFVALFQKAGGRIRRMTYFNSLLFPPIAAVRLVKRGGKREGDDVVPAAVVNWALGAVFGFERILLRMGSLPFGVSMLVVAEKPACG
ncbi:MAG: class I SAM-dependent methyltransferase [Caulobacterales bacterium]|nr:class I SAM-dependent methyltransferase [Caulobacterales bacterium]